MHMYLVEMNWSLHWKQLGSVGWGEFGYGLWLSTLVLLLSKGDHSEQIATLWW